MAEYIDRELAIKAVKNEDKDVMADYGEEYGTEWGFSEEKTVEIIMKVPAADVASVVHGEWLCAETDDEQFFLCSVCNNKEYWESNYCPNCGAKMDVEQEEE